MPDLEDEDRRIVKRLEIAKTYIELDERGRREVMAEAIRLRAEQRAE